MLIAGYLADYQAIVFFIFQERQNIYSLPFRVTNEVKLSVFRYNIVNNILSINEILFMIKREQQPDCPSCHEMSDCEILLGLLRNGWFHTTLEGYRRSLKGQRNLTWLSYKFLKDQNNRPYATLAHIDT